MLKLILIDDERATREKLLENIDWQSLRIEVAGEAKDGAEGLNLFRRIRPDIVLLDVRMPRMNGIECAAEIRKLEADSKIIFLSGYTDKEYLKSAIHIQAIDYIEKPIDLDDLYAVLKKTVHLCEEDRLRLVKQREANARIEQSVVWMKQELTLGMIRSDADPADVKRRFADIGVELPLNDNYRCVLLEFGVPQERNPEGSIVLYKEKILEAVSRRFANASPSCVAGVLDGRRAVAVIHGQDAEHVAAVRSAVEGIQQDFAALKPNGTAAVTAGIGKQVRGLEHVSRSFEHARGALELKFIYGYGSVVADENEREFAEAYLADEINRKLSLLLKEGDLAPAHRELADFAERLRNCADRLRVSAIKAELLSVLLHLSQLARENGLSTGSEWQDRELQWAEYLNRSTLPETLDCVRSKLTLLFEQAGEQRGKSKKIRAAMEYIKEHYSEDLSVVILADHLEMGTSYLSTLFKKETGKTLSEYIETFRMEKAKELLRDERLKMSEVAGSVGYRNANYFTSVFKRTTGQYPSEFRRNQFR